MEEESYKNNHWVFSLSVLQDKKLFPESRLRESFHVLRLSNRLCRLCHTVQASFPWALGAFRREQWVQGSWHQARWTSTDVPGSLARVREKEVVTVRLPTCLPAGLSSGHLPSTCPRGEGDIRTTYSVYNQCC